MTATIRSWVAGLSGLFLLIIDRAAMASGGLELPEAIEQKVSLEGLSGINLYFCKTYNENLWLYALICTVLMAVVGSVIAIVADLILKAFGVKVHKLEHKE